MFAPTEDLGRGGRRLRPTARRKPDRAGAAQAVAAGRQRPFRRPHPGRGARLMLAHLRIAATDEGLRTRVAAEIDAKTKPPGSLGRVEALALQMALAQGTARPAADPARLFIFAGDHGLVAEGVSAWPQEVTALMVANFLGGGAAATVFARSAGCAVTVVDAGVAAPSCRPIRRSSGCGIRRGTRNAAVEDALTADEVRARAGGGRRARHRCGARRRPGDSAGRDGHRQHGLGQPAGARAGGSRARPHHRTGRRARRGRRGAQARRARARSRPAARAPRARAGPRRLRRARDRRPWRAR